MKEWGILRYDSLSPQMNFRCGMLLFEIPKDFEGELHISLQVEGHSEMSSDYIYLCRKKQMVDTEGMLNV